ncbi:MAG: Gp49 family protein [Pigmentiphaga sp.]
MSDQDIEREIQDKGLTAPRVTPADIEANIASEHYFTAAEGISGHGDGYKLLDAVNAPLGLLTFCVLVLKNGFTVTGESACASPENFDAEIGRKIARQNAIAKCWPLMGYALRDELSKDPRMALKSIPLQVIAEAVAEDKTLLGMIEIEIETGSKPEAPTPIPDCPHAAPFRYCAECVADPCPCGLGK